MAQAKIDNSIPALAVSTRRSFLSQAASVAAGGTALALATVSATAGAAPSVDPIFALIEECREATKIVAAAVSEHSRREGILIEQGLGMGAFISVLDVAGPYAPKPTLVYKHEYIDKFIPPDRFAKVNAAAHAELDAKVEQQNEILGDSEKVMFAAMDFEREAVDILVWTVPTSIAGVFALLDFRSEAGDMDDDQIDSLLCSVADALRDLHRRGMVV